MFSIKHVKEVYVHKINAIHPICHVPYTVMPTQTDLSPRKDVGIIKKCKRRNHFINSKTENQILSLM